MTKKVNLLDPNCEPTDAQWEELGRAMGANLRAQSARLEAIRMVKAMQSPPEPLDLSPEAVAQRESLEQAKRADEARVVAEIRAEVEQAMLRVRAKRALRKQAEAAAKALK